MAWVHSLSKSVLRRIVWLSHPVILALFIFFLLTAQFYWFGRLDPYRCHALLESGRWALSQTDGNLSDIAHHQWEPAGCRLAVYSAAQVHDCLEGHTVVFIGDSTIRQIFWAAAARLDPVKAEWEAQELRGQPHRDILFRTRRLELEFIWDPWLNSTVTRSFLDKTSTEEAYGIEMGVTEPPTLILLGNPGLWAARYGGTNFHEHFAAGIKTAQSFLESNLGSMLRTPYHDIGTTDERPSSHALLAPVHIPDFFRLNDERRAMITPQKISGMQDSLLNISAAALSRTLWSYSRLLDSPFEVYQDDGLHVQDAVVQYQLDIVLNARCSNAANSNINPHKGTCCVKPLRSLVASTIMVMGALCMAFWLACAHQASESLHPHLPEKSVVLSMGLIAFTASWTWFADRSVYFTKVERQIDSGYFGRGCLLWLAVGLLSIAKTKPSSQDAMTSLSDKERRKMVLDKPHDPGFLPREQSDELKGLMQAVILIYHAAYASQIMWAYKIVRVFIAMYFFLSAYGHTMYFLNTGDLSLRRVATVLFRLNLLSVVLPYTLATTSYASYYFAPVISFWYLMVWLTFRILEPANGDWLIVTLKAILVVFSARLFIFNTDFLESLSFVSYRVFGLVWSAQEMQLRLGLDRYIVLYGIILATLVHRTRLIRTRKAPIPRVDIETGRARRFSSQEWTPAVSDHIIVSFMDRCERSAYAVNVVQLFIFVSACGFLFIMVALQAPVSGVSILKSKHGYNTLHSHLSPWIVLSILVLRNATSKLRSSYLKLPSVLGRISLETYVLQYHTWLGNDATSILMLGFADRFGTPLQDHPLIAGLVRILERVIITIMFITLADRTSVATGVLGSWMFPGTEKKDCAEESLSDYVGSMRGGKRGRIAEWVRNSSAARDDSDADIDTDTDDEDKDEDEPTGTRAKAPGSWRSRAKRRTSS